MLILFVDGIGWGPDDPASNPFARATLPHLTALLARRPVLSSGLPSGEPLALMDASAATVSGDEHVLAEIASAFADGQAMAPALALDASMGMPGLPQSGTGQGALITGRNIARAVGGHSGPFPSAAVQDVMARHSLWRHAADRGLRAALATAYPERLVHRAADGGGRLSSIARAAVQAGVPLRGPAFAAAGEAVPPFLGRSGRTASGRPIVADPFSAGRALASVAAAHHLTVYEHFATDVAGHRQDWAAAVDALERLDALIGGVGSGWPATAGDILVLMSDHGNLEDLGTHHHTGASALGAWLGPLGGGSAPAAVEDVANAIRRALGWRMAGWTTTDIDSTG